MSTYSSNKHDEISAGHELLGFILVILFGTVTVGIGFVIVFIYYGVKNWNKTKSEIELKRRKSNRGNYYVK